MHLNVAYRWGLCKYHLKRIAPAPVHLTANISAHRTWEVDRISKINKMSGKSRKDVFKVTLHMLTLNCYKLFLKSFFHPTVSLLKNMYFPWVKKEFTIHTCDKMTVKHMFVCHDKCCSGISPESCRNPSWHSWEREPLLLTWSSGGGGLCSLSVRRTEGSAGGGGR